MNAAVGYAFEAGPVVEGGGLPDSGPNEATVEVAHALCAELELEAADRRVSALASILFRSARSSGGAPSL